MRSCPGAFVFFSLWQIFHFVFIRITTAICWEVGDEEFRNSFFQLIVEFDVYVWKLIFMIVGKFFAEDIWFFLSWHIYVVTFLAAEWCFYYFWSFPYWLIQLNFRKFVPSVDVADDVDRLPLHKVHGENFLLFAPLLIDFFPFDFSFSLWALWASFFAGKTFAIRHKSNLEIVSFLSEFFVV